MDKDIKDLIEKINNATNKEEAIFIILQYGSQGDESFAKANKDGLLLFAAEILEAYLEKDDQEKNNKNTFGFEGPNKLFSDGATVIDYIEYTDEKRNAFDKDVTYTPFKEWLFKLFLITIAIILVAIFLAGLKQVFSWF